MTLWTTVQNTGTKARLRGEIVLYERELKARQEQFGIEVSPFNCLLHSPGDMDAMLRV